MLSVRNPHGGRPESAAGIDFGRVSPAQTRAGQDGVTRRIALAALVSVGGCSSRRRNVIRTTEGPMMTPYEKEASVFGRDPSRWICTVFCTCMAWTTNRSPSVRCASRAARTCQHLGAEQPRIRCQDVPARRHGHERRRTCSFTTDTLSLHTRREPGFFLL